MMTTVIFATMRLFLPLMLLLGLCRGAHAGAEPTPTDWLPQFNRVYFDGRDTVFDAGVTQIRLREGRWENAAALPINVLVQKQSVFAPRSNDCSVPAEVLSRHKNEYGEAEIWYCDLPERIWFATAGYCGEGDDDPLTNQGRLFSFSPKSGEVLEYPGVLPRCAELAGLKRIGNTLVAVTLYQEEYSQDSGQVLMLDLRQVNKPPKVLTNPNPTGAVVGISAYDKQCGCLWLATSEGIERLVIVGGKWERRYLDYEISADNRFLLTLSSKKPDDEKMWLGRILYNYPIEDLRGFTNAWNKSPASNYRKHLVSGDHLRIGQLLLPFYIAAIERTQEGWTDWSFAWLMGIVEAYQDNESQVIVRAFIEKLLKQPMNLSRRWEVVSRAKIFGVKDAKELEGAYFDELLPVYFSGLQPNYSSSNDAVKFSFEHPEYLPKLRDYYLTHMLTFDVEKYFLGRVVQYSNWPGYDIMASTITQGKKRLEHHQQLFHMCGQIFGSREENEGKLLAILQARLETDDQVKFGREKRGDPRGTTGEDHCTMISYGWIRYGGEAQVGRRVGIMLKTAEEHKELSHIVLEILNYKYATNLPSIEEWKRWWTSNSATATIRQ